MNMMHDAVNFNLAMNDDDDTELAEGCFAYASDEIAQWEHQLDNISTHDHAALADHFRLAPENAPSREALSDLLLIHEYKRKHVR